MNASDKIGDRTPREDKENEYVATGGVRAMATIQNYS